MKGIFLAWLTFVSGVLITIALLRYSHGRGGHLRTFFVSYALAVLGYTALFLLLPVNCGFLSEQLVEPSSIIDFLNGILILSLMFHCFIDVSYAVVLTGFAANLMLLIGNHAHLRLDELLTIYKIKGSDHIIDSRLNYLVTKKYLRREERGYRLCLKGKIVAVFGQLLKSFFNIGGNG